jgi:hypothetical protein
MFIRHWLNANPITAYERTTPVAHPARRTPPALDARTSRDNSSVSPGG